MDRLLVQVTHRRGPMRQLHVTAVYSGQIQDPHALSILISVSTVICG